MTRLDPHPPMIREQTPNESVQWTSTQLESDEPPLESDLHRDQINLLIRLLKYWWRGRQDFYISGNLTIYYNEQQIKSRDFRGPDIFVVLGADPKSRRSWVTWDEGGQYPTVIIELLSPSTASVDRGPKKVLYQDVWRVPDYFWFDPDTLEFAGFHWVKGQYEAIAPTESGLLWSEALGLYLGIYDRQLRWFNDQGQVLPLPEEQERLEKEQERLAKEQAQKQLKQLQDWMRSQGIDPDQRS
jgi:Uma2 family endonuclease